MEDILYYVAAAVAVIMVLVPHEFAHAYVAYRCGDATAKMNRRLTLNPLRHFDPAGFVMCLLVGFGWAKPVPINPSNFKKYRLGLFLTSIAGVVANYIIAFIAFPIGLSLSVYALPAVTVPALRMLVYLLYMIFYLIFLYSISVFVFNLLPFYPLDGFRVIESFTREINPVRRFLKTYGQYILIILVLESFLCDILVRYANFPMANYFDVLGYVQWFARNIIAFPITAMWNVIFGLPIGIMPY